MLWSSLVVPLLAQAAPAGPAQVEHWYNAPWFLLLAAIATLVVPYLVGNLIAKSIRMPDYGWKIGLILIALTAGVVIDIAGWPPKRGIDLSGGVKLVYEIDQEKLQEVNVDEIIRRVADEANKAGPFSKRNPAKVIPAKAGTIEVRLPTIDADRVQKVEAALAALDLSNLSAQLSGPTTARREDQQTVLEYRASRSRQAPPVDMKNMVAAIQKRINPGGQLEVAIRQLGTDQIEVDIPDVDETEIQLIKRKIASAGALEFHIIADQRDTQDDGDVIEAAKRQLQNPSNDVSNGEMVVGRWVDIAPTANVHVEPFWLTRETKAGTLQVLMVADQLGVTGRYLTSASMSFGISGPQVNFQFDSVGANKFGQLTSQNLPKSNGLARWLGVVLDGQLMSAATIRSKITNAGEITGDFTQPEVEFIVGVLNAGALPAALEKNPISQESISAELGRDTIQSSEMAMFVSGIAVLIFMLFYYRFAGIVADAAVLFNLLLLLALMILLKAAFTLSGLAGLVLSIGMAVDSNVLIYERMREEKERGAALRMVIRNGFGRAMATIIDMHSTTIITGLVLYLIGTDQLKGFAVTLVLGLLVNLFTAVFCARVVFDVAERKRLLTQLKMLRLFGDTKIDFVAIMVPAICVSVLISVLGVVCFWHRSVVGPGMFDTDFTGGTVVQIVLKDSSPMTDAGVRALVEPDAKLPDSAVVTVEGKENRQFIIRTSNQDPNQVKLELAKLFGGKLQTYGVGPLADLHALKASTPATSAPTTPPAATPPPTSPPPKPAASVQSPTAPNSGATKAGEGSNSATSGGGTPGAGKAPANKTEEKSSPPSADRNKSSAIPSGGARSLSALSNRLLAILSPDALLIADTSPAVAAIDAKAPDKSTDNSADDKTPKTKAPVAKPSDKTPDDSAAATKTPATTAAAAKTATAAAPAATTPAATTPAVTTPAATTPAATTPAAKTPSPATPAPVSPTTSTPAVPASTPSGAATSPPASKTTEPPAAPSAKETPAAPSGSSIFTEPAATSGPAAFGGGTETTLNFEQEITYDGVDGLLRDALGKDVRFEVTNPNYQPGDRKPFKSWTLLVALPPDQARPLLEKFREKLGNTPVFLGVSNIGGRVAGDTQTTALYALLASIAMIVIYIWIRFQNVIYGIGAVVALIHDVFITVAALAISSYVAPYLGFALVDPFKISLNVVAAILTICGYSISDTIVIFDRIREVRGKSPDLTRDIINLSVNQTLSRTVLTVFTVLLVTLILYISGGQAIHAFAFTMLIGLISGTYSSVYIAAPCLLWMRSRKSQGTTRIQ
ncbi:MAG TPA: protein translocase subunit SecD [Pirellulales bacterium]|nr:protein translocase subunit SecD [Pirellulales bacterium]